MDEQKQQQELEFDATERYQLRDDLIFAEREEGGRKSTVLKDPRSQKYYHFNEMTCAALRMFDGETLIEEIPARFSAEHGRKLGQKSVEGLVLRAMKLGLFDDGSPVEEATPNSDTARPRRRSPFNLLYIRLPAFDPSSVLRHFDRLGRILFCRPAYVLLLTMLAWCTYLQFFDAYTRYYNSFYVFQYFDGWVLTWIVLGVSGLLHECGHALAVRRYGGEVREMGFLLYLFQPALYTNASDAALMPRGQRIMVSLAGVYVEGFVYCLTVVIWYFQPPFSTIGNLAFISGFVLLNRIFINLIPLLRLDGYFILRDVLGVPNLRPRSFVFLLSQLPIVGSRFQSKQAPTQRERRIFLIYGSLSLVTVLAVLGSIYWRTYERWGDRWEWAVGATILTVIVLVSIRRRLKNYLQQSPINEPRAALGRLGGPA